MRLLALSFVLASMLVNLAWRSSPALSLASTPSVTVAEEMSKIRPTDGPGSSSVANVAAAQNEFVSFQLIISGPASNVSVTPPTLVGPSGSSIPSDEVRLFREAYINVTTPSNTESGGTGLWPDPLVPDRDDIFNEKRNAFPLDVPAGENRVVWVEIHVPQAQAAGTYRGAATVSGTPLGSISVPVSLVVWDFKLPSTSSLASTFFMGWDDACVAHFGSYTACGGSPGVERMHLLYAAFMLNFRVTADVVYFGPTQCTGSTCDWSHFDATYGPLFDGSAKNVRLPGAQPTTIRYVWNRTPDDYTAWAQHFRAKGWFDRTFDKVCDEPPNGCAWSDVTARAAMTHAADPQFRTLVTTTIDDADAHGVTNSINILSPIVNQMDNKPGSAAFAGNQRDKYNAFLSDANNRVYWYQSCESHGCNTVGGTYYSGWPSFMIDDSASQNRAQGMLSWLYRMNGVLYYDITYALANAWDNPKAFGGWGDGTLLYPGKPSIIGGTDDIPVGSIRLQLIRAGFQDYEYMKRVADLGDPGFAQSIGQSLFPDVFASNQTPDAVKRARQQLTYRILDLSGHGAAWARLEQTDKAVGFTGNWYTINNSVFSSGTAVESNQTGARATCQFNGTDVRWIGYRDQYSGIANVYIDGALLQQVDGYAATGQPRAVMYYVRGLPAGPHTLAIEVTGRKNSAAKQAWVWLDACDYVAAPTWTRLEQTDTTVAYTGNWYPISNQIFSGGSAVEANQTGARATVKFVGSGARWVAYRDPYSGIANVYLDGTLVQKVDLYAATAQAQPVVYSVTGLQSGNHTLAIEASGQKNNASTQAWVWVDAFEYLR